MAGLQGGVAGLQGEAAGLQGGRLDSREGWLEYRSPPLNHKHELWCAGGRRASRVVTFPGRCVPTFIALFATLGPTLLQLFLIICRPVCYPGVGPVLGWPPVGCSMVYQTRLYHITLLPGLN